MFLPLNKEINEQEFIKRWNNQKANPAFELFGVVFLGRNPEGPEYIAMTLAFVNRSTGHSYVTPFVLKEQVLDELMSG